MFCLSCASANQVEFSTEMIVHLGGLKNVGSPGVWLFPKLLICLDCGCARFTVPETELALLNPNALEREGGPSHGRLKHSRLVL